jgi:hypothetical protein
MRISDLTRFPHPVLAPGTGDYTSGEFDVRFVAQEHVTTGALTIAHEITLTENAIAELLNSGQAAAGCFVGCLDTYYSELKLMSWPKGRIDFAAGSLLNRVSLRPVIYLQTNLDEWNPGSIHPEFHPPVSLGTGDIIAIGDEFIISVGQGKLASIESIFELVNAPDVSDGEIRIDLERDRIGILVNSSTYDILTLLRGQARGQPVMMSGVYLPAIMEVLDNLSSGAAQFDTYRWHQPFIAKCDSKGIDPSQGSSMLENAQALLENPAAGLAILVSEGDI